MAYEGKKIRISAVLVLVALFLSCGAKRTPTTAAPNETLLFRFQSSPSGPITFLSTQLNPVEEAGKMRNSILKDFPGKVDFRPNDNSFLFSQIGSLLASDGSERILVGALHGDLAKLDGEHSLKPLGDVLGKLEDRKFLENLAALSRLNGVDVGYVPWMQATFLMVANKKALPFLPTGAALDSLTYDQLAAWARNIDEKTGQRSLGFPAGAKGLMHRFFQGYLYPSFTGSTLLKFRTPEAQAMWSYFADLWLYVHPGSLVYSTMSEPLIAEDVWIGWDHTARLLKVFEERPGDFVAFPAPKGPRGRGFMAVVSGLAIPSGVADARDPALLIDYLTRPEIQLRTLAETGFFPVVALGEAMKLPPQLESLSRAVGLQSLSADAVTTLLPIGLGERSGEFNNLYMLAFSQIVLEKRDPAATLDSIAAELQKIIDAENAACWLPDVSQARPCKLE
jgi:multiple sugar transport system substrate-binding protein